MNNSKMAVVSFFAKIAAAYGLWYVAYDLWLLPDGRFDAWLSHSVVDVSAAFLDTLGWTVSVEGRVVGIEGTPGLQVVNGCNGLTTIGLFIGFVVAFPGSAFRRLLFIPVGAVVIYAANIFRVSLLAVLQNHWQQAFEWIHNLGAPTFFYLVVFGLWVLWANYGGSAETPPSSDTSSETPASSRPAAA